MAETTGFTLTGLIALEKAIAAGVRSVSYEGKSATYGSLDEMLRVRTLMRTALGLTSSNRTLLAAHDRGVSSTNGLE